MPTLLCVNKSLRLEDHPALTAAISHNEPILAVYCTGFSAPHLPQGASLWWLGESLKAFNDSLAEFGGELLIHHGDAQSLVYVANQYHCTQPILVDRDERAVVSGGREIRSKECSIQKLKSIK